MQSVAPGPIGRHRHALPGECRRARQSYLPKCSTACLDECRSIQEDLRRLAPPFTRNLDTSDLFVKPVVDIIGAEINRRIADPTIVEAMPKVDELEADRVALRKHRQRIRKLLVDPMMSPLRLRNWIGEKQIRSQIQSRTDDAEIAVGSEFLITLAVFHPDDKTLPVQELQLLGSNTLQEAADAFVCTFHLNAPAIHDLIPNSYFLIEDQFHDSNGADPLSQAIIDWVRQERRFAHQNLGAFRRGRSMHQTRLDEIAFRPGSIYHYVHLGACRHPIMFTEVAIISDSDVRKRAAYPLQTALIKEKRQRCGVCDVNAAAFAVYGDRLASTNPFFYCADCYYCMHYSEDGNLLYDGYQVYPYICD